MSGRRDGRPAHFPRDPVWQELVNCHDLRARSDGLDELDVEIDALGVGLVLG